MEDDKKYLNEQHTKELDDISNKFVEQLKYGENELKKQMETMKIEFEDEKKFINK